MVYSLFCAEDELHGDVVIVYGDVLFERRVLESLLEAPGDVVTVVDTDWREYYDLRTQGRAEQLAESLALEGEMIVGLGAPITAEDRPMGQYIGLLKFSAQGTQILVRLYHELSQQFADCPWRSAQRFELACMTDLLQEMIDRHVAVGAVRTARGWLEFDTAYDYELVLRWIDDGSVRRFIDLASASVYRGIRR